MGKDEKERNYEEGEKLTERKRKERENSGARASIE